MQPDLFFLVGADMPFSHIFHKRRNGVIATALSVNSVEIYTCCTKPTLNLLWKSAALTYLVNPIWSMYKTVIRHFTLWTPCKIDLRNLQFKRRGKPEIAAAIASHLKYDALLWMINDWNLSPPLFTELGLAFVSLPRTELWTQLLLISSEIPKLLFFFAEWCCHDLWKKISSWSLFCLACRQKTPSPFFNRERLGGRL